jgi:hypothetical protein
MAKLTLNDFKKIQFEPHFPGFIIDLLEYLTGFRIQEQERILKETQVIKESKRLYSEKLKEEIARNPELIEERFQ